MSQTLSFYQLLEKDFKTLEVFLPIVTKVHAKEHPEFAVISQEFNKILDKSRQFEKSDLDITEELAVIDGLTKGYSLPAGACEAFTAVYKALAKINQVYTTKE
jgi:regulator of cell morphogenesis and NO signaling